MTRVGGADRRVLILALLMLLAAVVVGIIAGRRLMDSGISFSHSGGGERAAQTWRVDGLVEVTALLPEAVDERDPLQPRSDGALLVGTEGGAVVEVTPGEPGTRGPVLAHLADRVTSLAISSDEKTSAALSADGELVVWNAEGEIASGDLDDLDFASIALDATGSRLAAAGFSTRVWALPDGELLSSGERTMEEGGLGQAELVRFLDDALLMVDVARAESWSVADVEASERAVPRCECTESSAAWSPDGKLVAFGTLDGKIVTMDVSTGRVLSTQTVEVGAGAYAGVHAVLDRTHVLFSSPDVSLGIWDTRSGRTVWRASFTGSVVKVGLSPDLSHIAVRVAAESASVPRSALWRGTLVRPPTP